MRRLVRRGGGMFECVGSGEWVWKEEGGGGGGEVIFSVG